jgi:signal transduction histidine kinase
MADPEALGDRAARRPPERQLPQDLKSLLHDLRGLLNATSINAEVVRRFAEDEASRQAVDAIVDGVKRTNTALVAAFAVLELETRERADHDLRALAEQALAAYGPQDVALADGEWPRVRGDGRLIVRVIAELVRNAVQASARADAARPPLVSATRSGSDVTLSVRDWGAGFRTTDKARLLRLVVTSSGGVRGRGLIVAERAVRLHDGHLTLLTHEDGAEVRVTLPAA